MPRRSAEPNIATSRVLTRFIQWAEQAPEGAADYAAHSLILLTRVRLGMTQAQLARRCGLPQSHIARIEKGRVDVQLGTLRRIFKALACRLVLAPQPEADLEQIVREQARKTAVRRVGRVAGTMALEKQQPDDGLIADLVQREVDRLLQKPSSEIWEDD